MQIRFNKQGCVDAVIPTAVGVQPFAAPGDIIWSIPSDINPSKTIQVTENVQATDPLTGQLLFNADGSPQWKTQTVTNPDGTTSQQIVTKQVNKTVYLLDDPHQFTPTDISAVTSYVVLGSLDEAKANKNAELESKYNQATALVKSSALGTTYTYVVRNGDQDYSNFFNSQFAFIQTTHYDGSPFMWFTAESGDLSHTKDQFAQVYTDIHNFTQTARSKRKDYATQISGCQTVADLNNITITF